MSESRVEAIRWDRDGLELLDQRLLPAQERWLKIGSAAEAAEAIRNLVVRGAPAIGITAAYAAVLAARERGSDLAGWLKDLEMLTAARPTAVNLFWAVERMRRQAGKDLAAALPALEKLAETIHAGDIAANQAMAAVGAERIEPGSGVLTHCNTGSLATGGTGTALGVIVQAWREGRVREVFASETRPWFQGSRLTAWECSRERVPCKVLVEGAAASLFQAGRIDWVITGADRIAANGDVANKVGTLMLAVLARQFGARMMVVAPVSTVDLNMPSGDRIKIEKRDEAEIWRAAGMDRAPEGVGGYNPVFDITPAALIDVIVTEKGVLEPPFEASLGELRVA